MSAQKQEMNGDDGKGRAIPTRLVTVSSPADLPLDYGTTPGGTMFSTTPGGTRIIYDRKFLLKCASSPLAKSPLTELPRIPGCTEECKDEDTPIIEEEEDKENVKSVADQEEQFDMDV